MFVYGTWEKNCKKELEKLYGSILQKGIRKNKYKNSKNKNALAEKTKGSIFIYRSKEKMIYQNGLVLTSEEALIDNQENITHWTPNIYRYGTYKENSKTTKGHFEKNLKQINVFILDIDKNNINYCDILSVAYNKHILPTMIIKTTRGYQIYYLLEKPIYITNKSKYQAIKIAKKVSNNIREFYQKEQIPVDMLCNHFGIARFPNKNNILYLAEENKYKFEDLINFSIQFEDEVGYKKKDKEFYLIKGSKKIRQIDEKWYKLLKNKSKIKGTKGIQGRNNVLFTLALACYSSNLTEEEAKTELITYNNNLFLPLEQKEYEKTIKSAYSGKYTSANRDYIILLCKTWINETLTAKDLFTNQVWIKYKKPRKLRTRSHFYEWEQDLIKYLKNKKELIMYISKTKIIDEIKIPRRSLDTVLRTLKKQNKIIYKAKKGRLGGITIALAKELYNHIITKTKEQKEKFIYYVSTILETSKINIEKEIKKIEKRRKRKKQKRTDILII